MASRLLSLCSPRRCQLSLQKRSLTAACRPDHRSINIVKYWFKNKRSTNTMGNQRQSGRQKVLYSLTTPYCKWMGMTHAHAKWPPILHLSHAKQDTCFRSQGLWLQIFYHCVSTYLLLLSIFSFISSLRYGVLHTV